MCRRSAQLVARHPDAPCAAHLFRGSPAHPSVQRCCSVGASTLLQQPRRAHLVCPCRPLNGRWKLQAHCSRVAAKPVSVAGARAGRRVLKRGQAGSTFDCVAERPSRPFSAPLATLRPPCWPWPSPSRPALPCLLKSVLPLPEGSSPLPVKTLARRLGRRSTPATGAASTGLLPGCGGEGGVPRLEKDALLRAGGRRQG